MEGIKMVEQDDAELTYPYKQIKNTSICAAALSENELETGREMSTTKAAKKDPQSLLGREK